MSRQDQAKDPAKRLHRFEKEYGSLLVRLCRSPELWLQAMELTWLLAVDMAHDQPARRRRRRPDLV